MASFQEQLQGLNDQLEAFLERAKEYFSQLNDYEKYAWAGEGVGALLVIAGIVFLFV